MTVKQRLLNKQSKESSIDCKPAAEGDRNIKSSAYAITEVLKPGSDSKGYIYIPLRFIYRSYDWMF